MVKVNLTIFSLTAYSEPTSVQVACGFRSHSTAELQLTRCAYVSHIS